VTVARVLPNVTGLDKSFDYLVPESLRAAATVGALVRIELSGRRVSGWIVELDPADALSEDALKAIAKITGYGPARELIDLAAWASVRWAGRRRHFVAAASPERAVTTIPASQRTGRVVEPRSPASTSLLAGGGGVLRLPPSSDPKPAIMSAVALGPTLVVVPGADQAMLVGAALRRSGLSVAVLPHEWAAAAGGTDVVIGSRIAAWAPCPGLAAVVVIDEHDEALQDEGSPTWHARDVVVERGRRAGAPVLLVSPCPTLSALEHGPLMRPPVERERGGWPIVDVIDRTDEEPWKRSLVTSKLIDHLRDRDRTVVVVSNTPGRARLLACRRCRTLTRCERCDAAVVLDDGERLVCPRCQTIRPPVCLACGDGRFANLRPGVTRLREELEAAAGRAVVEVTGAAPERPPEAGVYVGTEAVLHRVGRADTVAFLDLDRELLAPRYRAAEQAMGLIVRAARLVGPRSRGGRVLLQTFLPQHDVVQAALLADPGRIVEHERAQRRMLGLPPYGALAEIGGVGSDEFVVSIPPVDGVVIVGGSGEYVARAGDWMTLGEAINAGVRPPNSRLRIAVDPPR
jgi:primosomal protein N' (replication factor Y) (superfamily II helicase)